MTSVDHDVIEAFRRAEQEMQDEWEARQAAAAKAQKSLRPQVFPEPAPTPRIFPAAPSTGGNCLAANGCCRLRITPAVGDRNPPSRYRREAGCSGPFRGLFRFVTNMIAVPGSGLVVSVLGLEYRFGEARGKRASGERLPAGGGIGRCNHMPESVLESPKMLPASGDEGAATCRLEVLQ
jgi:hypothetical protein